MASLQQIMDLKPFSQEGAAFTGIDKWMLVVIYLCNRAGHRTSYSDLARLSGFNTNTAIRSVNRLLKAGLLSKQTHIDEGGGYHTPNTYEIVVAE